MTVATRNKSDTQTHRDPTTTNMRWQQNTTGMANSLCDAHLPTRQLDIFVASLSEDTARSSIEEIARAIFPLWDSSELSVKVLTGGLTNKLFLCEYPPSGHKFLTRVYGEKTEQFIDRNAEIRNMHFLHSHGMGPKVHCTFRNGLCYDYFSGQVFTLEMIADAKYSHKIAVHLARMHTISLMPSHGNKASIESTLENYLDLVPRKIRQSAEKCLETEFGKAVDLGQEVALLKEVYKHLESAVVFCHNDLLPKNILIDENEVHFIDYEYASINYQAFDIGNLFTEFGGQESYDRSLYPKPDWQLSWIKVYLTEYALLNGTEPPTESAVYKMYVEANKLALASLLLWGFWGLIQKANSTIDVDFGKFALQRLGMYFFKKDEHLTL